MRVSISPNKMAWLLQNAQNRAENGIDEIDLAETVSAMLSGFSYPFN